jgi:hypothetical protein
MYMAQINDVYNYLKENYKQNEPIFLSDLSVLDMKPVSLRQQLKRLTGDGRLKRFDTGIYYLQKNSMFRFGSVLSVTDVIKKKYLTDRTGQCGYLSGMLFANQLGITSQVASVYEVYSNKATTEYRDMELGGMRVILRRPYVEVNDANVCALQFLDLMKEVSDIAELRGKELTDRLLEYMRRKGLSFDALKRYLPYYPDKIYRNMYEVGLLNGVAT